MKAKDTDLIDLGQYLRILRRRWLPASIVFVATAVPLIFLGFTQTPVYTAEGKLRFKGQDGASTLTKLEAGDQRGELKALKFQDSPVSTEIGLMRTVPIIQETILRANLKDSEGELISPQQLLSGLNIEEEKGTDVVTVTYQSADADVAKGAVASLLSVYLEQNLLENRAEAVAAREFLQKQLPGAENRARIAEAALRRFKESNQVIALEEETLKTVSSMGDINAKLTDVRSQISDVQAQFSTIQGRVGEAPQAAITSTAASQSAGIQQALAEYQLIEATLAAERAQLQDEHPVVVELEGKLQNLKQLLGGRVNTVVGSQTAPGNLQKGEVETNLVSESVRLDSQLKGLQEQAKNLEAARNSSTLRASVLPKLEQEQRELERRLEAAQSTYSLLLQRFQEVRVAENQNVGNARIVQPAEILQEAFAPKKRLYVMSGVMLGMLLAISIAFILDALDRSIKTVAEAKESFGLTILGVIPNFKQFTLAQRLRSSDDRSIPKVVVNEVNTSLLSESFHMLRNNLRFLNSDHPPRSILITSSVPGEGKSTVACNLAASIAQTGQRVLLIDADLYHPIQHWVWDIMPNRSGLSNVLVGEASASESMIEVRPNLMLLMAGSVPPNPVSLLDSQKMTELLRAFKVQFDYVILDTPPLSGGASTSILGKMVDGLLLVSRPKVTNKASVNYTKELFEQSQQNVLGLVVNGTIKKYEPYSHFLTENYYNNSESTQLRPLTQSLPTHVDSRK